MLNRRHTSESNLACPLNARNRSQLTVPPGRLGLLGHLDLWPLALLPLPGLRRREVRHRLPGRPLRHRHLLPPRRPLRPVRNPPGLPSAQPLVRPPPLPSPSHVVTARLTALPVSVCVQRRLQRAPCHQPFQFVGPRAGLRRHSRYLVCPPFLFYWPWKLRGHAGTTTSTP